MTMASTICLFAACSLGGWLWETLFAILRTGRWERRGFLFGPVCPIYGVGVVSIILALRAAGSLGCELTDWWQVFLVSFAGSMALEYATSWAMERAFHAYWWDYSNVPLNIRGRTCVPAGLLFGGGGLLAVYVLMPAMAQVSASVPEVALEACSYLVVLLMSVDATLTVTVLTDFEERVASADRSFNDRAEAVTERVATTVSSAPRRIRGEVAQTAADASARIVGGGERLERIAADAFVGSMDAVHRSVVGRIRGFRSPERPEVSERLSSILSALKSRR